MSNWVTKKIFDRGIFFMNRWGDHLETHKGSSSLSNTQSNFNHYKAWKEIKDKELHKSKNTST